MTNTLPEDRPSGASRRTSGQLVLEGRFRLVRAIGEGGMGVVWEAIDVRSGEARAIKFLRAESETEAARRRFVREAELLRGISHPNLVTTHEIAVDDDGALAIVMELLRGESLAARLARHTTLSLGQTCAILSRVATAVKAAHAAGVVHRDLKPDNVFLCVDPSGRTDVRVLDFGVAKKIEAVPDKLTDTGTLIGTPHYMSPEQASGERDLDGKTDVWAIGIMTFECLTGQMPVAAQNYGQLLMHLVQGKLTRLGSVRSDLPSDFLAAADAALAMRASRSDIGTFAAALVMRADPSIEPPPLDAPSAASVAQTIDMRTASRVPVTPRSFEAPAPPPPVRSRSVLVAGFLVLAAIGTGGIVVSARHKLPPAASSAMPPPVASPSASVTASVSAEMASSEIRGVASAPPTSPATASAKRPPKPNAKNPPAAPSASASTGRLQGGVGGDVPF